MEERKGEETATRERYGNLIDRKRPISRVHPPQPLSVRAAMFAPFAALSGYGDAVEEQARLTEQERELMEDERARLNGILSMLQDRIESRPLVRVRYFVPDAKKSGGSYCKKEGRLRRIDALRRVLVFEGGTRIPLSLVADIEYNTEGS
ncbi:MAG: hypothetical protein IJF71_05150 [Clostridia bacterium]|nr:hypothetical protein [Clostridia bacterium]